MRTTDDSIVAPSDEALSQLDAYWRAANYLTVAQIYLKENALLREPLAPSHVKPRLLGHWGTSPGLNLIYAHLNRLISLTDANVLFLVGPGHGGPAVVANVYLEGTYSEVYPDVSQDDAGLRRLVRQFSTPGGIPSHVGAPTPGSIHEGGELGYVLTHAFGAVFDNPELIAVAVVGDGEAETGPLEGSWKGIRFLDAARDGAVLPILHLNGFKISGPTVLGRTSDEDIRAQLSGHGYDVQFVEGDEPAAVHRALAHALGQGAAPHPDDLDGGPRRKSRCRAAALAARRAADSQGLDGAQGGGRQAGRGHLPFAPGAAVRSAYEPRASRPAGELDAVVPARGALRRRRNISARAGRPRSARRTAHEREPTRQRRHPGAAVADSTLARLRGGRADARQNGCRVHPFVRRAAPRRVPAESAQLSALLPGRDQLQPARRRVRGRKSLPGERRRSPGTTTWPTMAG